MLSPVPLEPPISVRPKRLISPLPLSALIAEKRELEFLQELIHVGDQALLTSSSSSEPSPDQSCCALCSRRLSTGVLSAHLEWHCDSLFDCPLCAHLITGGLHALRVHCLKQHPKVSSGYLIRKSHLQAKCWAFFYTERYAQLALEEKSRLFGPLRDWCPCCVGQLSQSAQSPQQQLEEVLPSETTSDLGQLLTHICTHLGYFRYLCLLCAKKHSIRLTSTPIETWISSTLAYLAPALIRAHLDEQHRFEFELYPKDEIIFARSMQVAVIERLLRFIHQCEPWWAAKAPERYTKRAIESILERDRDEQYQAQKRLHLAQYCALQQELFLQMSQDSYAIRQWPPPEDSDSDDSVVELPVTPPKRCEAIRLSVKRIRGTDKWQVDQGSNSSSAVSFF